jgi:hypothetical protein
VSAARERVPPRPPALRRGTKAVIEVLADGRRIAVPADGPASAEIRRAVDQSRFRWQLDVAGP